MPPKQGRRHDNYKYQPNELAYAIHLSYLKLSSQIANSGGDDHKNLIYEVLGPMFYFAWRPYRMRSGPLSGFRL
jgi:hypothetical protein